MLGYNTPGDLETHLHDLNSVTVAVVKLHVSKMFVSQFAFRIRCFIARHCSGQL